MTARSQAMGTALAVVLLANLFDWLATVDALALGIATEANPIGRWMLELGTWQSLVVKMAWVGVACLALWIIRDRRWALIGARVCAVFYLVLAVWHVVGRVTCL